MEEKQREESEITQSPTPNQPAAAKQEEKQKQDTKQKKVDQTKKTIRIPNILLTRSTALAMTQHILEYSDMVTLSFLAVFSLNAEQSLENLIIQTLVGKTLPKLLNGCKLPLRLCRNEILIFVVCNFVICITAIRTTA
jgi:hypothetical protein